MPDRRIKPVSSNGDKALTYSKMLKKHGIAVKYGFYCEAVMIDYAMIEDRLRSTLYHMGFLANRDAKAVWKKCRPYLSEIVDTYKTEKEDAALGINSISGKIRIVRCAILWAIHAEEDDCWSKHLKILKDQLEETDLGAFLEVINDAETWKDKRNEVAHAMMNKDIFALEETLGPLAEEGLRIGRALDAQEKRLKSGNRVRRAANLPMK